MRVNYLAPVRPLALYSRSSASHRTVELLLLVLIGILLSTFPLHVSGQLTSYMSQVGVSGDDGSIGSIGVRAEIRTHVYQVNQPDADYFWVGNYLNNGGLIEFGYIIYAPATMCPYEVQGNNATCIGGKLTVNGSEPLWSWFYVPKCNENNYYVGIGRDSLIEPNGTWHVYSILPNAGGWWEFQIDGHDVATANFPPTNSSNDAEMVAEKSSYSPSPGPLGPVEFRNLAYLKQDGWHEVNSLTASVTCGGSNRNCISATYGVALDGPNHIVAGTSVPQSQNGNTLWSLNPPNYASLFQTILLGTYKGPLGRLATDVSRIVFLMILGTIVLAVLRLKRKRAQHRALS